MRTKEQITAYNKKHYAANREKMLARAKEWRLANPERHKEGFQRWREKNRERHLEVCRRWYKKQYVAKTYGVPLDWYAQTLQKQNGVCAICKLPPQGKRKRLVVDHDHRTDKVRGLLCDSCNTSLNRLESVVGWYESASTYLNEHGNS